MRKLRLFWIMALAFILAIVLGVCGMLGFVGLAAAGLVPVSSRDMMREAPPAYTAPLGDYYLANGRSWDGVDERLRAAPFAGPMSFGAYALLDAEGRVVASEARGVARGDRLDEDELRGGLPVLARGERVGTVVLLRGPRGATWGGPTGEPPAFLRLFAAAGLGLTLVLVALSLVFAGWLSRPLRRLTAAAGELAGGRLDVEVPSARVRELDELSQAFNRMARALADADRQRRQLTADVAHELRTPLTIIKGRLEGIQDGVYQAGPDQVARLLDETALLERLIEDLRVLALAEAGQLRLFREPADPSDLLRRTAETFADQAAAQGVAIAVAAPGDLPLVDVDPQRMAQVLANLVSNALRHTPSGGSIALRASVTTDQRLTATDPGPRAEDPGPKTNDQRPRAEERPRTDGVRPSGGELLPLLARRPSPFVLLEVADTGVGIAPEDLPHVFERFWRADRARTRGSGGAGLGLAIARQIVAAHGGAIHAASEVGRGTTITIALPLDAESAAA